MYMSKSLNKWVEELKASLLIKGYRDNIPYDVFCSEFMILSGYTQKKVTEWVNNFKICKLISINNNNIVQWK